MSVEGVLRAVRRHVSSYDDDWSDQLSHRVTSNVLVTAAGIVSYKMFADGPLEGHRALRYNVDEICPAILMKLPSL
ncbi:hypothetical protein ANCCEY_12646 [Ancylostoma ceylanicum]|uniref:Uncharacterized protein n=1 Tax=Ancylostoma ceylanicum TaxID=53326 RepID=A0A0D6L8V4_9BILA|nr:hypothetical protein ANCCEY_12646 [Ancylostoma ceylanicum]